MNASARTPPDGPPDPFASYRLVGTAMAVLVLLVGALEIGRNWAAPKPLDFVSFWGAARLAIQGQAALAYDLAALHQVQAAVVDFGQSGARMPFPYMPAFLLVVMPFGFLPFPVAMAVWLILSAALYLIAVRRLFPNAGLLPLAFPPAVVNLAIGQNGFLTAAVFAGSMAAMQRRPFLAGLIAGLLILKPQLGLLLPVAFIAARQWRAIAGAAMSSVATALSGFVIFGPDTTAAWMRQLPLYGWIAREGAVGWSQLSSVYSAARQAGAATDLAVGLHVIVAAAAAIAVWRVWRSDSDPSAKAAVLACGTALASPYLFLYDQLILVIPLLWLAQQRCHPAILAALWVLPIAIIAQHVLGPGAINANPVLPIALLALVTKSLWRSGDSLPDQATRRRWSGASAAHRA
jgi:hypothetical protein